jgi:hypothetical protein
MGFSGLLASAAVGATLLCLAIAAAKDAPVELGPDVVVLRELEDLYEPVPFDHKSHAKMAEMWSGCVTCHHRSPQPTTQPAAAELMGKKTQAAAGAIPACKSCHPVKSPDANIRIPNLKGAYHRQCLNCHREWTHANQCVACHKPKNGQAAPAGTPTPDDIIGRMHPPIPEPDVKIYKTRFTPADGGNVLFRHKEHVGGFGFKCVSCHHRDNCANCHDATAKTSGSRPLRPGKTWADSHGPCMSCHKEDRCRHCHYKDNQPAPKAFEHVTTGQALDADHVRLGCGQCHANLRLKVGLTCGDSKCHKDKTITYPAQRPGSVPSTRPSAAVPVESTGATRGT